MGKREKKDGVIRREGDGEMKCLHFLIGKPPDGV